MFAQEGSGGAGASSSGNVEFRYLTEFQSHEPEARPAVDAVDAPQTGPVPLKAVCDTADACLSRSLTT